MSVDTISSINSLCNNCCNVEVTIVVCGRAIRVTGVQPHNERLCSIEEETSSSLPAGLDYSALQVGCQTGCTLWFCNVHVHCINHNAGDEPLVVICNVDTKPQGIPCSDNLPVSWISVVNS